MKVLNYFVTRLQTHQNLGGVENRQTDTMLIEASYLLSAHWHGTNIRHSFADDKGYMSDYCYIICVAGPFVFSPLLQGLEHRKIDAI